MITVTTAATNSKLVDVAVARTMLGIDGSGEDVALNGYIDRASDVIARHCNRVFGLEIVSEQFRLDRLQEELILNRYPVVGAPTVVEDGTTLTVSTDYEVDKAKGWITRLYNDRPCWWPIAKVTVAYSAGYTLPAEAPQALQQACLQLVKAFYLGADRDPLIRSESVTPMSSASYFGGSEYLPPDVLGLLKQFRKFK
ncbi:MAG: phage head-tail connector protein [Deltaproteobacteria bacterium]|nr:phage head-tail connector protein [Deltaproteobacteria bacterium]